MATGLGIGAFFQGFGDGYDAQQKLDLAKAKDKREAEAHQMNMEKGKIDLENAKREEEYKADLTNSLKELNAKRQGNVSGEAVDADGNTLGNMTFQNMEQAQQAGVNFKPGSVVQSKPMDDVEFTKRIADTMLTTGYKHGKVSLEQIEQARRLGKTLDKENVDEAVRTWMLTGDKNKVADVFNKGGKYKFDPEHTEFETVPDKDGVGPANVIAYHIGPDGKRQEVFNYQNYRFAGLSDDAYGTIVNQAKIAATKEKGDTFRTAMTNTSQERIAEGKNKIERAKLSNEQAKELTSVMKNRFTGIFRNSTSGAEADRYKMVEGEIGALAERYVSAGAGVNQAVDLAQKEIFKKYNIDTNSLADPKKK